MMNATEQTMEEVRGVYDVEYYWQDGYKIWHYDFVRVIAEDEDHALELATARVYMPYGANGVEYRGEA